MTSPFVVELPPEMKPLLEAEALEHGFATVADYLEALVRSNAAVEAEDPRLEAALREGLESGEVREANDAFWSDVGRRARQAAKKPRG